MIYPGTLKNLYDRADIKEQLTKLEKQIDNHIYENYVEGVKMPGLEMSVLKADIEEILVDMYDRAGWKLTFAPTNDRNTYLLYVTEK